MNKQKKEVKIVYDSCSIEFPRKVNEDLWYHIMVYFDATNKNFKDNSEVFGDGPGNVIDTPIFTVRSYSWNDCDDDIKPNQETLTRHNNGWHFWHKPSGFKMCWYKYPLRDPYCNMKITSEQFWDILRDCQNSLHSGYTYECDKWWEEAIF